MTSCHHSHGHKRPLMFVLFLSVSYMVAEIVGGYFTGSLSLLADAGHMAIDSASIALSLFALWISHKPPTDEKTYGYYRAEILAALVNGATLIAVSVWIFVEAVHRFSAPRVINGSLMAEIAFGGLLVNFISLYLMHRGARQSLNMHGVWLHLIADTLGSVSAVIAAILIWKFEWYLADPILSIFLGLLILVGAFRLISECVNVLLEGVPKGIKLAEVKSSIEKLSEVRDVHDLHVWTVTSGVPALSAHVGVTKEANHAKVLAAITELLKEQFKIEHVTLQLDPPDFRHEAMHF